MKQVILFVGIALVIYVLFVLVLIIAGKKGSARALAGFIPDCIVLFKNLVHDKRVSPRYKFILGALIVYLALPIDLVPDFIPVAGQLDDAIAVALVLRTVIKGAGSQVVKENWRGPENTLKVIFKIARIHY